MNKLTVENLRKLVREVIKESVSLDQNFAWLYENCAECLNNGMSAHDAGIGLQGSAKEELKQMYENFDACPQWIISKFAQSAAASEYEMKEYVWSALNKANENRLRHYRR